jgi:hypothetical protein
MIIYQDKVFLSTGNTYNGIYQIDKTKIKSINDLFENGSFYNIAFPIILQQTIIVITSIICLTIMLVIIALSLLKFTNRFKQLKLSDIFKISIYSTNIGLITSLLVFSFNRNFLVSITIFIAIYGINAFLNVLFTFIRNTPEQRKRIDNEKYL